MSYQTTREELRRNLTKLRDSLFSNRFSRDSYLIQGLAITRRLLSSDNTMGTSTSSCRIPREPRMGGKFRVRELEKNDTTVFYKQSISIVMA